MPRRTEACLRPALIAALASLLPVVLGDGLAAAQTPTSGLSAATVNRNQALGTRGGCGLRQLPGLRTLLSRVPARQRALGSSNGGAPLAWRGFERAATAIVGAGAGERGGSASEGGVSVVNLPELRVEVPCTAALRQRDAQAYRLALAGYTTPEIAAILVAEHSRAQLDSANARRVAGFERSSAGPLSTAASASTTLDSFPPVALSPFPEAGVTAPAVTLAQSAPGMFSTAPALRPLAAPPRQAAPDLARPILDAQVRSYAAAYDIDPRLVSAMIRQESNWQPESVSPKGAIGLMQLMPGTASMLGVDPRDPVDNIRGGIAYLADLLKQYGDLRSALIAYNAGPDHANQVLRGERTLYPETRRYLDALAAAYPFPPER